MALNKNDFLELGKSSARTGTRVKHHFARDSQSWQAVAYWKGFDSIKPVIKTAIEPPPPAPFDTTGWPGAAAQHAAHLWADIERERSAVRRARLHRAINRMRNRHAVRT